MRVVRVLVREEHGINGINTGTDELHAQLGRRVNEQSRAAVGFDHGADPCTLVPRVRRPTNGAMTSDLRHAEAGSRTEEGELHARET